MLRVLSEKKERKTERGGKNRERGKTEMKRGNHQRFVICSDSISNLTYS